MTDQSPPSQAPEPSPTPGEDSATPGREADLERIAALEHELAELHRRRADGLEAELEKLRNTGAPQKKHSFKTWAYLGLAGTLTTLYLIGRSGDGGVQAPATPNAPAVDAPSANTPAQHPIDMQEAGRLLRAGASVGEKITTMSRQDICDLALSVQGPQPPDLAANPALATCPHRIHDLDKALLLAGSIAGPAFAADATQTDICAAFHIAAVHTDLVAAQAAHKPLPPKSDVVTYINDRFRQCAAEYGNQWAIQQDVWENVSRGLVFRRFYPE